MFSEGSWSVSVQTINSPGTEWEQARPPARRVLDDVSEKFFLNAAVGAPLCATADLSAGTPPKNC